MIVIATDSAVLKKNEQMKHDTNSGIATPRMLGSEGWLSEIFPSSKKGKLNRVEE